MCMVKLNRSSLFFKKVHPMFGGWGDDSFSQFRTILIRSFKLEKIVSGSRCLHRVSESF